MSGLQVTLSIIAGVALYALPALAVTVAVQVGARRRARARGQR